MKDFIRTILNNVGLGIDGNIKSYRQTPTELMRGLFNGYVLVERGAANGKVVFAAINETSGSVCFVIHCTPDERGVIKDIEVVEPNSEVDI